MKKTTIYVKAVPYQELISLRDAIERLDSWQKPLAHLEDYFTQTHYPINKKQVVKQYYACAEMFQTFYETYGQLLTETNQIIDTLTHAQKMIISSE